MENGPPIVTCERKLPDTDDQLVQGQMGGLYVDPGEFLGGRMASSLIFDDLTITDSLSVDFSDKHTGSFLDERT